MEESFSKKSVLPKRPYFSVGGNDSARENSYRTSHEREPSSESKIQDRIRRALEKKRAKEQKEREETPPPFYRNEFKEGGDNHRQKLQELKDRLKSKYNEQTSSYSQAKSQTYNANSQSKTKTFAEQTSYLPRPVRNRFNDNKGKSFLAKKFEELNPKIKEWAIKGGWFICFILVLRLIFAENGVIDYLKMDKNIHKKLDELNVIKGENFGLMVEIEKIKNNSQFQKKLVRDHLGFISHDEYLVLFAKESQTAESENPPL